MAEHERTVYDMPQTIEVNPAILAHSNEARRRTIIREIARLTAELDALTPPRLSLEDALGQGRR